MLVPVVMSRMASEAQGLAALIGHQAAMRFCDDDDVDKFVASLRTGRLAQVEDSDDDSSDEEDMHVQRMRAKAVSEAASQRVARVAAKCDWKLPKLESNRPPLSPFAAMAVLADAAVMLDEIQTTPMLPELVPRPKPLEECLEPECKHVEEVQVTRPLESAKVQQEAVKPADAPDVCAAARKKALKARRPTSRTVFRIDAADEVVTPAVARETSLTRAYDVLGVVHCSLEDDVDVDETGEQQQRESSLVRSYDALDASIGARLLPGHALSPPLAPVRPPSRPSSRVCAPRRASRPSSRPAISAIELDLGCPQHQQQEKLHVQAQRHMFVGSATNMSSGFSREGSLTSLCLGNTSAAVPSKFAKDSIVLPQISVNKASMGTKLSSKMRSGSATRWEIPESRTLKLGGPRFAF